MTGLNLSCFYTAISFINSGFHANSVTCQVNSRCLPPPTVYKQLMLSQGVIELYR